MVATYSSHREIAIAGSVISSTALIACNIWLFRHREMMDSSTRRLLCILVLPIFGFLARAFMLWSEPPA